MWETISLHIWKREMYWEEWKGYLRIEDSITFYHFLPRYYHSHQQNKIRLNRSSLKFKALKIQEPNKYQRKPSQKHQRHKIQIKNKRKNSTKRKIRSSRRRLEKFNKIFRKLSISSEIRLMIWKLSMKDWSLIVGF